MNWLARKKINERSLLCQSPAIEKISIDLRDSNAIPQENYFSFLKTFSDNNCFPITNSKGELLSSDRQHFTIAGVEYFSNLFFLNTNLQAVLNNSNK